VNDFIVRIASLPQVNNLIELSYQISMANV